MVVIDKLMKHIHFIPFKKIFNTKQLRHFLSIELYNIKVHYRISVIIKISFLCPYTGRHK